MQTYTPLEHRPGDTPQLFDLDEGLVTQGADGKVVRLDASQQIIARTPVPIEPGERYRFRVAYRRVTNSPDPSDDAITAGITWLGPDKSTLGTITIDTVLDFTTGSGRRAVERLVTSATDQPSEITAPPEARYAVPWVQCFGLGHATDVEICALERLSTVPIPVARTFYVTMNGADSNVGTSLGAPLASLTTAIAKMAATAPDPCVTIVHPGEYLVPPDTTIPANCALYGYDLRVTKLILANFAGTVPASGTARRNNMFQMSNGIKARGFTFTGLEHEPFTLEGGPPQKGYAFVFKPGAFITRSPYIADCSMLHDFTQDQMVLPIAKATGNPLMPLGAGNLLADGSVLAPSSPLRSVVVDSFTAINPNGVGYAMVRNAFVQLVSVFTNWSRVGIWTHQGGQVTIANSNNTFGDYALASTGFRNTIKVDGVTDLDKITVRTAAANVVESQTESIVTHLMTVHYPTLTGWNGLSEAQVSLTERDTRTLLRALANDFRSGQDRAIQFFIKGLFNWNAEYHFATSLLQLFLDCWEQIRLEVRGRLSGTADTLMLDELIRVLRTVVATPANHRVPFASVIEATGQQFSYAGSGVNYNALPFSQRGTGDAPNPSTAMFKLNGGKIFATFSTEVGDTYLGEDLRVDFERNTIEGQAFSRGVQNITLPLIIGIGG